MGKRLIVSSKSAGQSPRELLEQLRAVRKLKQSAPRRRQIFAPDPFPSSKMHKTGWNLPTNLTGAIRVSPPSHRSSSKVLGAAYPFLTESGEMMRGAYIGENKLSRSPFCFDPWDAYEDQIIRSHSVAILGVKGVGKSMLAKSWASRLARLGRCIAVPHDPNGEWARVAEYVGGGVIAVGPGRPGKINLLDSGSPDTSMSSADWRHFVLQDRRTTLKAVIEQLRRDGEFGPEEHTALDEALATLDAQTTVTVVHVFEALRTLHSEDQRVLGAAAALTHTLRRLVRGDLAGLFDGPSTVEFDTNAPMMVVDTSTLKNASPETQALTRLSTSRWVRNATTGSNRRKRVIVHEEAAIALMNDVHGGAGLWDRVADEKIARHSGTSNWYLLHRISDLDALGDRGSAMQSQALGLLADCDTRVSYAQHSAEIGRSRQVLGWNDTQSQLVSKLQKGEGLWQVGSDRLALVRNKLTSREFQVFRTDTAGGQRDATQ